MVTIKTRRLILIALDREQLSLALNNPTILSEQINVRIAPEVFSEESRQAMAIKISRMDHVDVTLHPWYTYFLLIQAEDRQAIGVCGFKGPPTPFGSVEIGYSTHEAHRGQGYMTEAVEALIDWAFQQGGCRRVSAETLRTNLPSQRVLTKTGMSMVHAAENMLYWQIDKDQYIRKDESGN